MQLDNNTKKHTRRWAKLLLLAAVYLVSAASCSNPMSPDRESEHVEFKESRSDSEDTEHPEPSEDDGSSDQSPVDELPRDEPETTGDQKTDGAGDTSEGDGTDDTEEPADPEPADPEQADPEPADPEPADPEQADPEPADPEPADPEPADPEPADPEPADPEPADPEPADPEPAPTQELSPPRSYEIGDVGPAGGLIVYRDLTDQFEWTYLELAPEETEWAPAIWGGSGMNLGINDSKLGSGARNTREIVSALGPGVYAAYRADTLEHAHNGEVFADWFLPSKGEMSLVFENELIPTQGYSYLYYWTSTERHGTTAWVLDLVTGSHIGGMKENSRVVISARAMRSF